MRFNLKKTLRSAAALATAGTLLMSVEVGVFNGYELNVNAYEVYGSNDGTNRLGNTEDSDKTLVLNPQNVQSISSNTVFYRNGDNTPLSVDDYNKITKIVLDKSEDGNKFNSIGAMSFVRFTNLETVEIKQDIVCNNDGIYDLELNTGTYEVSLFEPFIAGEANAYVSRTEAIENYLNLLKTQLKAIYVPQGMADSYKRAWDYAHGDYVAELMPTIEDVNQKKPDGSYSAATAGQWQDYIDSFKMWAEYTYRTTLISKIRENASRAYSDHKEIFIDPLTYNIYLDDEFAVKVANCDSDAGSANIPATLGDLDLTDSQITTIMDETGEMYEDVMALPVSEIMENAFNNNGCPNLTEVNIAEEGVETINEGAFWGCQALEKIILPESLNNVAKNAFRNCKALNTVVFLGKSTVINDKAATISNGTKGSASSAYFDGIIYGWRDSTAQTYADKNNYTFKALDDMSEEEIYELLTGEKAPDELVTPPETEDPVEPDPVDPWEEDIRLDSQSQGSTGGGIPYWDANVQCDEEGNVTWEAKKSAVKYVVCKTETNENGENVTYQGAAVDAAAPLTSKLNSMPIGDFSLYVRAYKTTDKKVYIDSKPITVKSKQLGKPGAPVLQDTTGNVIWEAAANATQYALIMVKGSREELVGITTDTKYLMKTIPAVQYSLYVRAYSTSAAVKADDYNDTTYIHQDSDTTELNKDQLGYVKAPTVDESTKTVTWEQIENVSRYEVVKTYNHNSYIVKASKNSNSATLKNIPNVPYTVHIRAYFKSNSNFFTDGEPFYSTGGFDIVGAPNVDYNGNVTFYPIEGAKEYQVIVKTGAGTENEKTVLCDKFAAPKYDTYVNAKGSDKADAKEKIENIELENTDAIVYTLDKPLTENAEVFVRAYKDDKNYSDGEKTLFEPDALGDIPAPTLELKKNKPTKTVHWTPVKNAVSYRIYKEQNAAMKEIKAQQANSDNSITYYGKAVTADDRITDYTYKLKSVPASRFSIWVRAFDKNGNYKDSPKAVYNENEIGSLPAPKVDPATAVVDWENAIEELDNKLDNYEIKSQMVYKSYYEPDKKNNKIVFNFAKGTNLKDSASHWYKLKSLPLDRQVELYVEIKLKNKDTKATYTISSKKTVMNASTALGVTTPKIDRYSNIVTWGYASNANRYEVWYSASEYINKKGYEVTKTSRIKGKNGQAKVSFKPGVRYTVWIRAYDSNENYRDGQEVTFVPNGVVITKVQDNKVVTFTQPTIGVKKYYIYKIDGKNKKQLKVNTIINGNTKASSYFTPTENDTMTIELNEAVPDGTQIYIRTKYLSNKYENSAPVVVNSSASKPSAEAADAS